MIDFGYLLRVLLQRKWLIIAAGIVSGLVSFFLTQREVKKYKSISQISTGFTITDDIKINNENFSFFEADTKFNNAIVTFTSPAVLNLLSYELVIHDLESQQPFRFLNGELAKDGKSLEVLDRKATLSILKTKKENLTVLSPAKTDERKIIDYISSVGYDYKSLQKNISVYRLQRTDYIQIESYTENPELSAFLVNNLYKEFINYYRTLRYNKSIESIDTLRSMMEKKKQILDLKNSLLTGEGMIDPTLENTSNLDLISNLEQSLQSEKNRQTNLYYELRKVNQRINNQKTGTVVQSIPQNNNEELFELRNAKNQAYRDYLNSGSTDKNLLEKYNRLNVEYQKKAVQQNNSAEPSTPSPSEDNVSKLLEKKADLEFDIEASSENIASIQGKINALKGTVVNESSKSLNVELLIKEVDLANKEYLDAKQKYNDAIDITTSSINNFRQVLEGQPPVEPEKSKRNTVIALSIVSAIVFTVLLLILLTYIDSKVRTPSIFTKATGLRLLSIINFINLKKLSLSEILSTDQTPIEKKARNQISSFKESIRKLRYEIEKSGESVFLFTSTKKGQGKTTIIQALAFSLSMGKKSVLIIDTNFCNNDLTTQLEANPILEKISTDGISYEQISEHLLTFVKDIPLKAGLVHIIGSEGGDYTPTEILPSQNLLNHIELLKKIYDFILLEGPPLNEYSDSKELSDYAECVIGVFSSDQDIKQIDKESIDFLKNLGSKYMGSVLNKVDFREIS